MNFPVAIAGQNRELFLGLRDDVDDMIGLEKQSNGGSDGVTGNILFPGEKLRPVDHLLPPARRVDCHRNN